MDIFAICYLEIISAILNIHISCHLCVVYDHGARENGMFSAK